MGIGRSAAAGVLSLVMAWGGVAFAAPPQSGKPVLSSRITLTGSTSASTDVVVPVPFVLEPQLFDVSRDAFHTSRIGSGFVLMGLTGSDYPPTLIGMAAPEGSRSRSMLFPFGEDGAGRDSFDTYRFPAGRYRLTLFTDGPVTMSVRLPLPRRSPLSLRPTDRAGARLQRANAPQETQTGSVLGVSSPGPAAERWLAVQTVAGRLAPSVSGYASHWCVYEDGPPATGYLPSCLGGAGFGVQQIGPLVDYDYAGFSAFVGIPGSSPVAVSRSLQGAGRIQDQSSLFLWLPLPPVQAKRAAGTAAVRAMSLDTIGNRLS